MSNKITKAEVEQALSRVLFKTVRLEGTTSTFVHAFLDGQFYLASGHSACVDPANYNAEVGFTIAYEKARRAAEDKLWELLGFQLYDNLRTHANAGEEQAAPVPTFPKGQDYPLYQSHKLVRAFQIGEIANGPPSSINTWLILPLDGSLPPYEVSHEWRNRHSPQAMGWIVFYTDGYVSYSPADAFTNGYTEH